MRDDQATLTRYGMGYRFEVPDAGLRIQATHLKRTGGELHAELAFYSRLQGAATVRNDGLIDIARYNLTSGQTRRTLAAMLSRRIPLHRDVEPDWEGIVVRLCVDIAAAENGELPVERPTFGQDFGRATYILDPFLPFKETSVLFGPGGSYKSATAQAMALSLATGHVILPGIVPAGPMTVLYLDYETTRNTLGWRCKRLAVGAGLDGWGEGRLMYVRAHQPLVSIADGLQRTIEQNAVDVLIVDSAVAAMGAQGERGDVADTTVRTYEALGNLGTTNLLVDHLDKSSQRENGAVRGPYGSTFKTNYARDTWEVVADRGVDYAQVGLFNRKTNDRAPGEERAFRLVFEDDRIVWHLGDISKGDLRKKSERPLADRLEEALVDGAGYSTKELAETVGTTVGSVRAQLHRHGDRFEQVAGNLWKLKRIS